MLLPVTNLFGESPTYSIDTSSLIDLGRIYRVDVFPTVWAHLENMIASGLLRAPDEVYHELAKQDDEILAWVKSLEDLFVPLDEDIQTAALSILANHPGLVDIRKRGADADPWVIALAQIHGAAVVTEEKHSRNSVRPKIPDVCGALAVECVSIADLFQREGVSL